MLPIHGGHRPPLQVDLLRLNHQFAVLDLDRFGLVEEGRAVGIFSDPGIERLVEGGSERAHERLVEGRAGGGLVVIGLWAQEGFVSELESMEDQVNTLDLRIKIDFEGDVKIEVAVLDDAATQPLQSRFRHF